MRSVRQRTRRAARRSRTTASRTCPFESTPRTIIESPGDGQDVVVAGQRGRRRPDHGLRPAAWVAPTPTSEPDGHGSADGVAVDRTDGHRHGDAQCDRRAPRRHRKPRRRRRSPRRRLATAIDTSGTPPPSATPALPSPSPSPSPLADHRRSPTPSPSPATSSSSVNRRPSRRTAPGSRSPPGPTTDRAAPTSTSGRSATTRPARSRRMGRPSSPRGTATQIVASRPAPVASLGDERAASDGSDRSLDGRGVSGR